MAERQLRVRRSIQGIYEDFKNGTDTVTLEKLMVAWQFIKALPASDVNSFMTIGGFHGEPFAGRGSYDTANYWGGYCNHGNILFPVWHRAYLHRIEKALQSVPGCESVMLPYWDQTYKVTTDGKPGYLGVPPILTDEFFTFTDGVTIPNPLRSFTIPQSLQDAGENNFYGKPAGYETVRYPLSGLVGTAPDRAATEVNNSAYLIPGTNTIDTKLTTSLLNQNVISWLTGDVAVTPKMTGIDVNYHKCLDAPCYTVFSNITSRVQWNTDHPDALTQALELPHGEIHLAVGGINAPFQNEDTTAPLSIHQFWVADANGDMGENETAGLDPIFFFHHCNVDRIFWIWQVNHNATDYIDISVPGHDPASGPYPGTNNINNQPPVGYEQTEQLNMESSLYPFKIIEHGYERNYRPSDCINIESQLGMKYESLSIDNSDGGEATLKAMNDTATAVAPEAKSNKVLIISGINRAKINGSFVITAYASINGTRHLVGVESVLSRWKVTACRNCMTHLEVSVTFSLSQFTEEEISNAIFDVQINGRRGNETEFAKFTVANQANMSKLLSTQGAGMAKAASPMLTASFAPGIQEKKPFSLQVI